MDLKLIETGNGGDIVFKNSDLVPVQGFQNMIYLALFGGNPKYNSNKNITEFKQNFDWWGNNILFPDSNNQMNSLTENLLATTPLTSGLLNILEQNIEKDLEFLKEFTDFDIFLDLVTNSRLNIIIKIVQPENQEDKAFIFIWDFLKQELLQQESEQALNFELLTLYLSDSSSTHIHIRWTYSADLFIVQRTSDINDSNSWVDLERTSANNYIDNSILDEEISYYRVKKDDDSQISNILTFHRPFTYTITTNWHTKVGVDGDFNLSFTFLDGIPKLFNWYLNDVFYLRSSFLHVESGISFLDGTPVEIKIEEINNSFDFITHISWARKKFVGAFSPMTRFTSLIFLNLNFNSFSGIFNLGIDSEVEYFQLRINNNEFNGTMGDLPINTSLLFISNNAFTGLPSNLLSFTKLFQINVFNNSFIGTLPDLTGLLLLEKYDFHSNEYNLIPASISDSPVLNYIDISSNSINAPFPDLSALTSLGTLYANNNGFSGSLQEKMPPSTAPLSTFIIANNDLTGTCPDLDMYSSLLHVNINNNSFSGKMPELSSNMLSISANGNDFSLFSNVFNDSFALLNFDFTDNNLTVIPDNFWDMLNIVGVYLEDNQITGTLPTKTFFPNLVNFHIGNNSFTGNLPILPTMIVNLRLQGNNFVGLLALHLLPNLASALLNNNSFTHMYIGGLSTVLPISFVNCNVNENNLNAQSIENMLVLFNYSQGRNGYLAFLDQDEYSPLTPKAQQQKDILIARGWTVLNS